MLLNQDIFPLYCRICSHSLAQAPPQKEKKKIVVKICGILKLSVNRLYHHLGKYH